MATDAAPSAPPRDDTSRRRSHNLWVGGIVAAAVVILDQATKQLALALLDPGRMVDVWADGWGFELTFNPGGAFSLPAPSWFFLAVTVIVVGLVVRNLPRSASLWQAAAWGLLLAGALGNAIDRVLRAGDAGDPGFLHGHVVDFVAWGSFPRFNVADAAITVGFVLMLVTMWRDERRAAQE